MKRLQTALFFLAGLLAGCTGNAPDVSIAPQPAVAETPAAEVSADQASADTLDSNVAALKTQLNLSEQQTEELNKIFKETRAKKAQLQEQMISLHKLKRERIDAVLTTEQKNKLKQMNNESLEPLNSQQPPESFQQTPE